MAGEIIRVFIIEGNVPWREAIDALLNRQPDVEVACHGHLERPGVISN